MFRVWTTYISVVSPFLSNGDFEGDKTKTLPWSCSAVIFAGNLSDYDESHLKYRLPNSAAGISVTAWDHIFSDHIFLDNIFSNFFC
ncbi:hypothetical protein HID58_066554 [Brassica napus]|uniref:Uncharacterized protein n=1 Tax=Brassica napus TaxID=3708 RepID=A0ABQ7ZGI1_BRANA|nr:hypothetical protein HID58_066554 [Brassica napus]